MNASFSILQKLKNQFLQTVSNKNDYHFAFAPFSFSMTNEDFYFLKNNATSGVEAKKYVKELSEFSIMANSISKKPNLWAIDSNQLLFNLYEDTLTRAKLIDSSSLTPEENIMLEKAKNELYKSDDSDTPEFTAYKVYETKLSEAKSNILDHESLRSAIDTNDTIGIQKWELEKNQLLKKENDLLIEWNVKGFKTVIENAKKVFDQIVISKTVFLQKWQDAKTIKLSSNTLTDEYGFDFKVTSCLPNSICDYQADIWRKISIEKSEITQLVTEFETSVAADIINEFGNIEIILDKIEFEYCFVDIIRPWFDEELVKNQNWKYNTDSEKLSDGSDNLKGNIPAFPVKIVLIKNVDLMFTPDVTVNEEVKDKLLKGDKLFFGSMLLKNIPINLHKQSISSLKIHNISNTELSVIASTPVTGSAKLNKMQLIQNIQKQNQIQLKQKMVNQKSNYKLKTEMSPVKIASIKPVFLAPDTPVNPRRRIKPKILHSSVLIKPLVIPGVPLTLTPTHFKINGTICDETKTKLKGVEIQIIDTKGTIQSVLTDENGFYAIDNIPAGSYTIKTKKAEYVNVEKTIQLNSNFVIDLDLTKKPIPVETFQVLGMICKKMPLLPNPRENVNYI